MLYFFSLPFYIVLGTQFLSSHAQGPDAYAPNTNVQCPDVTTNPLVREFSPTSQALGAKEVDYFTTRKSSVITGQWSDWLGDGSSIGYSLSAFAGSLPNVSIAISGGGYRAAQYGAGVLSALDARNSTAKGAGTGGLLQVSSYLSALSGGSWLTGSLYLNDFPMIRDLVLGNGGSLNGWLLDLHLLAPNGSNPLTEENAAYYGIVADGANEKTKRGIDASITDVWARAISFHFLNGTTRENFYSRDVAHGAGQLWSLIPNSSPWQQHSVPFPLIQTVSRGANATANTTATLQDVQYEISPVEWGSFDPSMSAMMNMTYAGTQLVDGKPANSTACVTGFDQAGFVMATSASLFDSIASNLGPALSGLDSDLASLLKEILPTILESAHVRANDLSRWPNPFQSISGLPSGENSTTYLNLDDGGSAGENIPLGPLLVRARNMDFILAVDGSADTTQAWPNGASLINTAQRQKTVTTSSHQPFPPIPASTDDFISQGVNQRPTLFGCDPTQNPPEWPLVLYLPNAPPVDGSAPVTNTNTFKLQYTTQHTEVFLDQAYATTVDGFVPNNTGKDSNWPRCLQCAAIDRARYKTNPVTPRSSFCQTCFTQYCYNATNPPSKAELPNRQHNNTEPGVVATRSGAISAKVSASLIASAVTVVTLGNMLL